MTMRLKGWHRLWIFMSLIYMCLIIVYCFIEFPKPERIAHKDEFYKKLSKQSLAMLHENGPWNDYAHPKAPPVGDDNFLDRLAGIKVAKRPTVSKEEWDNAAPIPKSGGVPDNSGWIPDKKDDPLGLLDDPIKIEMPNGHTIFFLNKFKKVEMESAANEYWTIVKNEANKERIHLVLYAFLFWLFPCLGLYLLGWGIRWVYQGFKSK